jgi:Rad3-related DNA helicase
MSLRSRVAALLDPSGRVAARWPRFEVRAAQRDFALDTADAIERGEVLLAEAPTGVGKSLAYLVPGVLHAIERDRRVVVATATRSLQDQLYERDVPAVLETLGVHLPVARLKGKQNYLCPRALDLVDVEGAEEREALEALRRWAAVDPAGDLDRFDGADPEALRRLRARVATDPQACTALTCRRGRECFWMRARRVASESRLLIVNHALLAVAGGVEGLLPDFDVLVVDEAHRLEGVLLGQLERSVSRNRFEEALRALGTGRRSGAGLLARLRGHARPLLGDEAAARDLDALAAGVGACREVVGLLFDRLEPEGPRHAVYGYRARYRTAAELLGSDLQPLEAVLEQCGALVRALMRAGARLESAQDGPAADDLAAECEQVAQRLQGAATDLGEMVDAQRRDRVYWRTSGRGGLELHDAPVSVGDHARGLVLSRARAAILASATLTSGGSFGFLADRLGLGEEHGLPYDSRRYPSPFPLERQMRAFVLEGADEARTVADVIAALAESTGRNQLVLFTAHERLRRVRTLLADRLPATVPLLAQDHDGPVSVLVERFRAARGAVLLGVQSLWEGVDFPGDALEILMVAKLPFSVPDDPLVEARAERIRERGGDPFREDAVPEAVLRFRQGVGRLIRRADDRGVLVVCDPRLTAATYRRPFLEALPVHPEFHREPGTLAREAARFLADGPVPVEES